MNEMISQLKTVLNSFLADDEIFDLAARLMKKSYDSLIKAGFTEEQATSIVAHQGAGVSMKS